MSIRAATPRLAAHRPTKSPAPSPAEIKAVINKSYNGDSSFQFPAKLGLKAVPTALHGTPLAKTYAKNWSGKNDLYDYSSLFKLNLQGHAVFVVESVTDAVDDLRIFNSAGRQILSNVGGAWSK